MGEMTRVEPHVSLSNTAGARVCATGEVEGEGEEGGTVYHVCTDRSAGRNRPVLLQAGVTV